MVVETETLYMSWWIVYTKSSDLPLSSCYFASECTGTNWFLHGNLSNYTASCFLQHLDKNHIDLTGTAVCLTFHDSDRKTSVRVEDVNQLTSMQRRRIDF